MNDVMDNNCQCQNCQVEGDFEYGEYDIFHMMAGKANKEGCCCFYNCENPIIDDAYIFNDHLVCKFCYDNIIKLDMDNCDEIDIFGLIAEFEQLYGVV